MLTQYSLHEQPQFVSPQRTQYSVMGQDYAYKPSPQKTYDYSRPHTSHQSRSFAEDYDQRRRYDQSDFKNRERIQYSPMKVLATEPDRFDTPVQDQYSQLKDTYYSRYRASDDFYKRPLTKT